jgi:hypothetical protein
MVSIGQDKNKNATKEERKIRISFIGQIYCIIDNCSYFVRGDRFLIT